MTLLERTIVAIDRRLVILSPEGTPVPPEFSRGTVDAARHQQLLEAMQRLRGSVYLADGAVQAQELTACGRHCTPQDRRSWHLLMLDESSRVSGCIWYLTHPFGVRVRDLRVSRTPLAGDDAEGQRVRRAVEADIVSAHAQGLPYGEVGGWAVSPDSQCPAEGFVLAMAAYSLSRLLGGAIGLTTATRRHASAVILRRLGLARFGIDGQPLPAYFDPRYGCEMELLRFDSRRTNPKYEAPIELLKAHLAHAVVVAPAVGQAPMTIRTEPAAERAA